VDTYAVVAGKFLIGMLVMILQINLLGKYEFSINTPLNQIQNYVLGGIIGGVIYNNDIKILDYVGILCTWCGLVLTLKWVKQHNVTAKQLIDGKALIIIEGGKINIRGKAWEKAA